MQTILWPLFCGLVFIQSLHAAEQTEGRPASKLPGLDAILAPLTQRFAQLKSYRFEARLHIETSEEFLNLFSGEEKKERTKNKYGDYKVTGCADGNHFMVRRELLEGGVPTEKTSFFLKPDSITTTTEGDGGQNRASIVPIETPADARTSNYLDVVLLGYGFLSPNINAKGIPALAPEALSSKNSWDEFLREAKLSSDPEGNVLVESMRGDLRVLVVLKKDSYLPIRYGIFTKERAPIAIVEIKDYFSDDPKLNGMPKKFQMTTYFPRPDAAEGLPLATWTYDIAALELNAPIPAESFDFDPSAVDVIWDEKNKTGITVPR